MTNYTKAEFLDGKVTLYGGDNRDVLRDLPDNSIDSIVTDPPYALVSIVKRFGGKNAKPANDNDVYSRASRGFMGKQWDTGEVAFSEVFWAECLRVLKPGGHVAAFSGTRTYHRMACAIEDAGFEIRDQLAWAYGSGFPKSHDVSKAIDKAAGVKFTAKPASGVGFMGPEGPGGYNVTKNQLERSGESTDAAREWQGWGTALKPSWEPICLGRKPLSEGTVAANVLRWGTGALNIGACRVGTGEDRTSGGKQGSMPQPMDWGTGTQRERPTGARWPANVVHDGSDEVVGMFPISSTTGKRSDKSKAAVVQGTNWLANNHKSVEHTDSGCAARFFYSAKASKADRNGSKHPTVKPIALMEWLATLITPPGGTILDPFAGSGTTGAAAVRKGFSVILCEREDEYVTDIKRRMSALPVAAAVAAQPANVPANDNVPTPQADLFAA